MRTIRPKTERTKVSLGLLRKSREVWKIEGEKAIRLEGCKAKGYRKEQLQARRGLPSDLHALRTGSGPGGRSEVRGRMTDNRDQRPEEKSKMK